MKKLQIDEHEWSLGAGQLNGEPLLARYRQFPDDFPKPSFPSRLNVIWSMIEKNDHGLPSPAENQRMTTFENRLVAAVERSGVAVLAVVLTGSGRREFVFQARDDKDFLEFLGSIPQEARRYPVEVHATDDAGWDYIGEVVPTSQE